MNYFTITLLTISFCAHYFGNTVFLCAALMLDDGDPCKDPAAACEELGQGAFVYNPEDCHQSYACVEDSTGHVVPSDQPFTCPDDLTFDYEIQNCSSKITSCSKACVNKGCNFMCTDETSGYVADINDCNIYYFCYMGTNSAPAFCPESEPYFDGSGCSDKEYLCCDACTVYCARNDSGKNIADPFDCTAYYTCESGESYPNEDEHFNCNEGEQFDIDQGICTDTTETCENICTAKSTTKPTERTTFYSQSTTIAEVTTNPQSTIASHESSTTIVITTPQPITSESTEANSASQTPTILSSESPEPSPTNVVSTITSQQTTKPESTRSGSTETLAPTNPGPKINNKQQQTTKPQSTRSGSTETPLHTNPGPKID